MRDDGVIAVVEASSLRRVMGAGALFGLGAVLLYTVFSDPPGAVTATFGIILALVVVAMGTKMWRATSGRVELREDALVDSHGTTLVRIDEIEGVDRGILAFKPSNGFVLTLKSKQPRSWAPGLWWRLGRYLGVGGAVSAGETKFMAEQIAFLLSQRSDVRGD